MRLDLRSRILIFTAIPIATLAFATLWMVNHRVSGQVLLGIREDLTRASAVVENVLEARGSALELAGQVIVQDPKFFSALTIPGSFRDAQLRATVAGVARDFNLLTRADLFEVTDMQGHVLASVGAESSEEASRNDLIHAALTGRPVSGILVAPRAHWQVQVLPVFAGGRVVGALLLGARIDVGLAAELKRLTRSEVTFVSHRAATGTTLESIEDRGAALAAATRLDNGTVPSAPVMEVRTSSHTYLTLVRPLPRSEPGDAQAYVMQRPLDVESAFLRETQAGLLELGAIALIVALLAGVLIAQRITLPVQRLVRGAEEMERGNYDYPLEVNSDDEIGYLAARFQDMRHKQRQYVSSLEEITRVKSEFLTVASHELRTPISVIRGYQELMTQGSLGPVAEEQQVALHAIGRSVLTLTRIAEDATRMAQIASARLTLTRAEADLTALVEAGVTEARAEGVHRKVDVLCMLDPSLGEGNVDAPRLTQAIANLVRNGIRFTPDGGEVEVSARREAGVLVVMVRDNGVGIPLEKQRHVFDRASLMRDSLHHHSSSTLEFNSSGLGLGLSIASGIVNAHGGKIELESEPGVGSRFTVRIPLEASASVEAAA
jgi:signal transduction histidine kinase